MRLPLILHIQMNFDLIQPSISFRAKSGADIPPNRIEQDTKVRIRLNRIRFGLRGHSFQASFLFKILLISFSIISHKIFLMISNIKRKKIGVKVRSFH